MDRFLADGIRDVSEECDWRTVANSNFHDAVNDARAQALEGLAVVDQRRKSSRFLFREVTTGRHVRQLRYPVGEARLSGVNWLTMFCKATGYGQLKPSELVYEIGAPRDKVIVALMREEF